MGGGSDVVVWKLSLSQTGTEHFANNLKIPVCAHNPGGPSPSLQQGGLDMSGCCYKNRSIYFMYFTSSSVTKCLACGSLTPLWMPLVAGGLSQVQQ